MSDKVWVVQQYNEDEDGEMENPYVDLLGVYASLEEAKARVESRAALEFADPSENEWRTSEATKDDSAVWRYGVDEGDGWIYWTVKRYPVL